MSTSPSVHARHAEMTGGYGRRMLKPGDPAPDFELLDQNENAVKLSELRGRKVLVYFYPKADTPGCTKQACGLNEVLGDVGDTVVLGSARTSRRSRPSSPEVRPRLPAAVRSRSRRRRVVRRVEGEEHVRPQVHGDRTLRLPRRREGQDRRGVVQGQPRHAEEPARRSLHERAKQRINIAAGACRRTSCRTAHRSCSSTR